MAIILKLPVIPQFLDVLPGGVFVICKSHSNIHLAPMKGVIELFKRALKFDFSTLMCTLLTSRPGVW
jgi:hypothetical protein